MGRHNKGYILELLKYEKYITFLKKYGYTFLVTNGFFRCGWMILGVGR